MFTYSHLNTPIDQWARAQWLSYFINMLLIIVSYASPELDLICGLTMFDTVQFFRGYRRCFICRIPESCRLRKCSIFFELHRLSQVTEDDCYICRISRICKYWLLERFSIRCRISEDILSMLWQCSCRISEDRVFSNVRFSRRITEDALFVELSGFPKINFFNTAQFAEWIWRMAEDVRQRSIFLRDHPRCRVVFRRFQ